MRGAAEEVSRNLGVTFDTLARHSPAGATERFGSIKAVSAGVPTPTFNRVFVFEPFEETDLMAAIDWFTARNDPFWVTGLETHREDIEAAFGDDSYEKSDPPQPGMARALSSDLPSTDSDVEITRASSETELDAWAEVAESVFEFSEETNRRITPFSVLDGQGLHYFVGRIEGQLAACGMLSLDGTVAGVYVIGVDEAFRRRGIGEAMTWEVLREGRANGAEVGVLQSTQMGYPLYDKMGFDTEVEFRHFVKESW